MLYAISTTHKKGEIMKRILLLALTLFILTGCVFTESEFTINKDNSVDFRFMKGIDKSQDGEKTEDMVKEDSLRYVPYNFSVKAWENDKYRGTESIGKVQNILELNKLPMVADTSSTNQPSVVRKEETSTHDLYTISYLPNVMELIGGGQIEEDNEEYKDIMAAMLATFEHKITWKVPFKVIATNASTKNDSLGVYTWDIKGAPADSIYLQYEVPKKLAIFGRKSSPLTWIIIGLVVVVLALMFFNMFKKSASKGVISESSTPIVPASPEDPPVDNQTPESGNMEEDSQQTDFPDETS